MQSMQDSASLWINKETFLKKMLFSSTEQYLVQRLFNVIIEKVWSYFMLAHIIATVL